MQKPIRVGIAGYGFMGGIHAEVWGSTPGAEIVAVAEPVAEKRQAAVRRYGCSGFQSADEMIRLMDPPDIVVVATQAPRHYENVLLAIKHSHVICEKPIALTLAEADEMVYAAEQAGHLFRVHHQHTFTDAVRIAYTRIEDGTIGNLKFIEAWGKGRLAPYDLMEVGLHSLDLMRKAAGEPEWVFGHAMDDDGEAQEKDAFELCERVPGGRACGRGVGKYLFGYYGFSSGVCGSLKLMTVEAPQSAYMATEFQGTKGRLRVYHTDSGRLFYSPTPYDMPGETNWVEVLEAWNPDHRWLAPTRRFAQNFLTAIRENGEPGAGGKDGLKALEMAHAIYWSHFEGETVFFPLRRREHPLAV